MDKLGLDYLTCQFNRDVNSTSNTYQCEAPLSNNLNSDDLQTPLYLRRWKKRQSEKLEATRFESQLQQEKQLLSHHPSKLDPIQRTNNLNNTTDSSIMSDTLATKRDTNHASLHVTTSTTGDASVIVQDEKTLFTNIPFTTSSSTDINISMVATRPSTIVNGVISPGNYKKILIDRFLLSQSKSESTTDETTTCCDEKVVFPLLEKAHGNGDKEIATKTSLKGCTNYLLNTDESVNNTSLERMNRRKSISGVVCAEIEKCESLFGRVFPGILAKTLCDNMCESIFNSIQLVYDSKYSKQYAASKLSSDLQAVRPNKNIQTNIFGQDNSSEDFVMGIVDKKFDLICPATDKKTHFVGEKHDQESSVPAFSQSDLSNLLHLLLAKCSKNCDMNDHHHSGAVIRDTGIPSCKENQSVCIENAETSPPSEIGSDSYYSLSLFKLNHSHNNQLCQEEITEESLNCERQQQQQSYYSSLSVSAYNCSENSINHQNNNAVSQNQSSSTHYPAECMNDTPNDSSLLVCSQSNTTKSINSVLSSLTSVISDIHSFPPPNQHHLPSSHKSLASYTSSHLPKHEDSSGLFISSSALPPSSSPLKKQLKYTGTAHATSYHNNISSSTSVYSNLSSCGSTTRLPSPSFHKLPNMFIRPSEYNPTEDNFYSKLHNRITNSMQQQGEKQYTTKEQLQYPTRIASISSYNGDNDDNTGVTTTGQKHPNLSFMNTDDFQLHSDESLSRKISASSENVSNAFLSKRINDEISSNHCNKRNTNACVLKEAFNKRITTTNTNTTTTTSTSSNNNSNNIPTQHTKNSNSLHVCIICSRQFSRSDMLLRHAHVHTGHRPFECTICGQAFSRSDHLSTHQRTHTGQRPYQCPLCYYSASRRDMITRHLRVHQRRSHIIPISEGERSKKFYFTAKI